MKKLQTILSIALTIVLCLFFALSIADTSETVQKTNFDQDKIVAHLKKFTENGPRSIAHTEANQAMLNYIASTLEGYGLVKEDTVDQPAYMVQEFVGKDTEYQNWYLSNIIVHIPATTDKTGDKASRPAKNHAGRQRRRVTDVQHRTI